MRSFFSVLGETERSELARIVSERAQHALRTLTAETLQAIHARRTAIAVNLQLAAPRLLIAEDLALPSSPMLVIDMGDIKLVSARSAPPLPLPRAYPPITLPLPLPAWRSSTMPPTASSSPLRPHNTAKQLRTSPQPQVYIQPHLPTSLPPPHLPISRSPPPQASTQLPLHLRHHPPSNHRTFHAPTQPTSLPIESAAPLLCAPATFLTLQHFPPFPAADSLPPKEGNVEGAYNKYQIEISSMQV